MRRYFLNPCDLAMIDKALVYVAYLGRAPRIQTLEATECLPEAIANLRGLADRLDEIRARLLSDNGPMLSEISKHQATAEKGGE